MMNQYPKTVQADIIILGGGVAGLWLLNRLRDLEFNAILLEANTLGYGQSIHAQGIIHGGTKYALQGKVTDSALAVAQMPKRWQSALEGTGEIDLSSVSVLSKHHYLFAPKQSLISRMTSFIGSKALQSDTRKLHKDAYPEIFKLSHNVGSVYELDEMVIDTETLIQSLAQKYKNFIYKIDLKQFEIQSSGDDINKMMVNSIGGEEIVLTANHYIFTAGEGNERLLQKSKDANPMQRRPLHMVYARFKNIAPIYAHVLGVTDVPRITVTTHRAHNGDMIWYIGGQVAETGLTRTEDEQILKTKTEVKKLLPFVNPEDATWHTFKVNRAEPKTKDGTKPAQCFVRAQGNVVSAWPTKLVMAPVVSDKVIALLKEEDKKSNEDLSQLPLPRPHVSKRHWDEI